MEIKITISDTGAGGTASMQVSGESLRSGTGAESSAPGGPQVAAPPEVLRAAAAIGAIDAGPAPGAGSSTQAGAPPPFSSGSDLGDVTTSPGISAGPSAAAAPDSGSVVESVVDPGENGK
jgi:hypothetical protein